MREMLRGVVLYECSSKSPKAPMRDANIKILLWSTEQDSLMQASCVYTLKKSPQECLCKGGWMCQKPGIVPKNSI